MPRKLNLLDHAWVSFVYSSKNRLKVRRMDVSLFQQTNRKDGGGWGHLPIILFVLSQNFNRMISEYAGDRDEWESSSFLAMFSIIVTDDLCACYWLL